jgi:predicted nucleic acid-binding protein
MPEITIVDTSSLFYFHRVGLFELFKKLYGHITVPEAVKNELIEGQTQGEDVPQLEICIAKMLKIERETYGNTPRQN